MECWDSVGINLDVNWKTIQSPKYNNQPTKNQALVLNWSTKSKTVPGWHIVDAHFLGPNMDWPLIKWLSSNSIIIAETQQAKLEVLAHLSLLPTDQPRWVSKIWN